MTWWIKFTTDKGAPKSRSRIHNCRGHTHTVHELRELARFLQLRAITVTCPWRHGTIRLSRVSPSHSIISHDTKDWSGNEIESQAQIIWHARDWVGLTNYNSQVKQNIFLLRRRWLTSREIRLLIQTASTLLRWVATVTRQTDVQCGVSASMGYFIK